MIATPDAAVQKVAAAVRPEPNTVVFHLAGSLGTAVLGSHPRGACLHPLVALSNAESGARRLAAGAWFAVSGDPDVDQLVKALGGRSIEVADEHRTLYHAAATIASNHLVALLGQVERVAAEARVPFEAYLDLVEASVANVRELGPAGALTGAVRRGDWETVAAHEAALPESERRSYEAMVGEAARLAGRVDPRTAHPLETVTTIAGLRKTLERDRAAGKRVGFVPTMGFLHDGHASLIRRAAVECDVVVVSIFVNPLQFGAGEDLDAYPRNLEGDRRLAEESGAHLLFVPDGGEMWPGGPPSVGLRVGAMGGVLDGASRPGHFDGVATVVAKLFAAVGPSRAYFGEKDYQQLRVIQQMVADLAFPVEVVGCPTVREADGLAMSSRNSYLSEAERAQAGTLWRALQAGRDSLTAGQRNPQEVVRVMTNVIDANSAFDLDYAAAVQADDLSVPAQLQDEVRLLVAARLGRARLIDNLGVIL